MPSDHRWSPRRLLGLALATALLVACGEDPVSTETGSVRPVALAIVSGDLQDGSAGATAAAPLVVRVTGTGGAWLAGETVNFAIATGAGSVSPATATTGAAGEAATTLTLGTTPGMVEVRATVAGTSLAATFHSTVLGVEPDSTAAPQVYNPDWTEASHGKVAPDYATVFPQSTVNTIEITLTAGQWGSVRANMTSLFGYDFGARAGAPGGFPSEDPDYVAVPVRFNGKVWKKVGWRPKGNSSLASAWGDGNYKLPFRLKLQEFEDTYPAIKGQRLHGFKELSFSPGFKDFSLIREKVTADIFRAAGVPAARTAFYRVYVDFGAGLKYCGVYAAVEVIDDTMVKDQYGEDKGNLYKPESRLGAFVAAEFEKKNNKTSDWSDVQAFLAALHSPLRTTDAAAWRAGLEQTFDVDHFLRYLAVNNAVVNWDSYGVMAHNYYLYRHSTRQLLWIPWDHNEALTGNPGVTGTGGTAPGPGGNRGLSLTMNEIGTGWPLLRYLADDPVYFARYQAHLKAFYQDVFTEAAMDALLERATGLVAPYATGSNGEQPGYTYLPSAAAFTAALLALKQHVRSRRAVIQAFNP